METVITKEVKTETENIQFGWYDTGNGEFRPVVDHDDYKEAAAALGCTDALISTLVLFTDIIIDNVSADLAEIWKRLDKAGI